MPVLQRVVKPKTRRGKQFLTNREPLILENDKTAILMRATNSNDIVNRFFKDLTVLKKPNAVYYDRKKDWRPMEDAGVLESELNKKDSSLFMFGSHNKKRPNNVILGRMYDFHILDMIEFGIENFKSLNEFKNSKVMAGTKPCLIFAGEPFENVHEYQRLKNLLIDFFRGPKVNAIRLAGLEHVLTFTAVAGKIHLRSYKILLKKSGTKLPRIEVEEIGPHADLVVRRTKLASDDLYKRATRQPRSLKQKVVKNIKKDKLGTKLGRIHMQKQDIQKLQTRKVKGLRKTLEERKAERKLKILKRKKEAKEGAAGPSKVRKVEA